MLKGKQPIFLVLAILAGLVLTACGDNTATPVPATTTAAAATTSAATTAAATGTTSATTSAAGSSTISGTFTNNPADYGLKTGKPYNGTNLNFLICCNTATQFASLIDKTTKEFTAMTGITVKWDNVPYAGFQQKLLTESVSGTGQYDNVAWVDSWGPGIKSFLLPLDDKLKAAGISMDDFSPAYVQASKSNDGKSVVGIPFRGHAQTLFYRKDVFDKLGIKPPTTWQEVDAVSKVIKEKMPTISPISMYYGVNAGQNVFLFLNHLWGNGGDVFDQGMHPIFNNAAGVEATTQYMSYLKDGYTTPNSVGFAEGDAATQFGQGKSAMMVTWSWYYSTFTNKTSASPDVYNNLGFLPAPSWEGKSPITYAQIWPVGISKFSKHQDAAWEYLKWLTNPRVEKEVALDKSDPKFDNVVVVHNSVLSDPEVNATTHGLQNVMASVLKTARTEPLIPEWPQVESTLQVAINNMAGGKPIQATLDQAAKDVDAIMKKGGYYK
ncbi:MAG: sugar ABC transporter substrate-binding protein [Chloroflexi bacterium]|nr:sugar ABC transporter substrate-binding protein [Chloroflexota bacterium]OJV90072.1 MAG: hypothetical protein BGO39_01455 [Chloroflexi bacterium 54-19]